MNHASVLAANRNRRAKPIVPTRGIAPWEKPAETAATMEPFWKATSRPDGTETPNKKVGARGNSEEWFFDE
jgi:hypothetical protein